jgi:phage gpG-like protein
VCTAGAARELEEWAQQLGATIHQKPREQVLNFKRNARTGGTRFAKAGKAAYSQKAQIGERTINIPARPFLGISADDALEIADASQKFMLRVLNGVRPGGGALQ